MNWNEMSAVDLAKYVIDNSHDKIQRLLATEVLVCHGVEHTPTQEPRRA